MTADAGQEQAAASLVFTKLIVRDVQAMAAFYKQVAGMTEGGYFRDTVEGREVEELILMVPGGGHPVVLFRFLDGAWPRSGSQESILGFGTTDIEGFVRRAEAAGGRVAIPAYTKAEHGVRVVFLHDPEDHLIQVIQRLPG